MTDGSEQIQEAELARQAEALWEEGMLVSRALQKYLLGTPDGPDVLAVARRVSEAIRFGTAEVAEAVQKLRKEAGLVHVRAEAVTAPLFAAGGFFLAADKVQVKYEMLRAHFADGDPVSRAAVAHGYSRAAFYLVAASFADAGMAGLVDERRGRRGPVKLRPEIAEFIRSAPHASGVALAAQVADRFGVTLHRRTIQRARGR